MGILAPGGYVVRTDSQGRKWELLLAGFRNCYDFAFGPDGEGESDQMAATTRDSDLLASAEDLDAFYLSLAQEADLALTSGRLARGRR